MRCYLTFVSGSCLKHLHSGLVCCAAVDNQGTEFTACCFPGCLASRDSETVHSAPQICHPSFPISCACSALSLEQLPLKRTWGKYVDNSPSAVCRLLRRPLASCNLVGLASQVTCVGNIWNSSFKTKAMAGHPHGQLSKSMPDSISHAEALFTCVSFHCLPHSHVLV